jgi:hypothetical protein
MQGLCTGHENPDLWFSESIDSDIQNNRVNENSPEYKQRMANVKTALAICNTQRGHHRELPPGGSSHGKAALRGPLA